MATRQAKPRGNGDTSRKVRKSNLEPYTNDGKLVLVAGTPAKSRKDGKTYDPSPSSELTGVLILYFGRDEVERDADNGGGKYSGPIAQALSSYLRISNPITSQERADLSNLIRCLKEFEARLYPFRIPKPVRKAMKANYTPLDKPLVQGKVDLSEEVNDLLARVGHLRGIIESIKIPTPSRTNLGKPARDKLIQKLGAIFDMHISPPNPQRKKRFINRILSLYKIKAPRNLA